MKKTKYLHIAIIVIGILFITIPVFHNNIWFDESYSVGIANKSFLDIWQIGSKDVHPVLYYWILHIIYLIFGSNIYIYRLISVIPIAILAVLGYTHIKKDFGEKVGILFSFFTLFLPIASVYSGEIRMYTYSMLFVTVMAIYAYRIYTKPESIKNWVIFGIFSLASAYTHYYGLATAGIINLILFIYILKNAIKQKKYTKPLKCFTISALTQIILYIPWIYNLIWQINGVSNGFWISGPTFELLLQIFCFQFTGNLDITFIPQYVAIIFGIILLAYTIYSAIITKESKFAGKWAIRIYLIVFAAIFAISIKTPILYARYFLNLTGLFIFFMAFFIAKSGKKILNIIICGVTLIVAIIVNTNVTKMNYDTSNTQPVEYIKQDLQQNDMILFGNEGSGFVISMHFTDIQNYFYDRENWNVEPAYKAFGKEMIYSNTLDELKEYNGRIWVINSDGYGIYEELEQKYKNEITLIKQEIFYTKYHEYNYSISLIEKTPNI